MDAKLVNPIIDAFMDVMPQMGFSIPRRLRVYLQDRNVISRGVTVMVGFTRQMHGNVIYNMTEETARFIASTMMMGMHVPDFDVIAQSAICEMSNMLTARAATNFSEMGLEVDISTPNLTIGEDLTIKISDSNYLNVEMDLGGHIIDIALSVDRDV